jgi:hypothetical protein
MNFLTRMKLIKILEEELALNEKNDEKGIQDPLLAKKK